MPLPIGETFAGYAILRLLGSGGMGEVYLAQHPRLPRQYALKILRPDVYRDTSFRARFIREAEMAASLSHPHIVGVHDRGEYKGQLWIAMDYVDGLDAAHLLERRYPAGMHVADVVDIISAVASALDYAHKRGLIHRDVKPANVMLADLDDDERRVLLTDFGIARPIDDTNGLTTTNMTVGTLAYSAPEQLMGQDIDGRADQYALAATTYYLLTGKPLYPHTNPAVVISKHLNAAPPALGETNPDLSPLDPILVAGLAKDPNDRFGCCADFARAFAEVALPHGHNPALAPTTPAPIPRRETITTAAPSDPTPDGRHVHLLTKHTLLGVAVAMAILLTISALGYWSWSHREQSVDGMAPAQPDAGPFTGVYRAEFGSEMDLDGTGEGEGSTTGTYALRSVCGSSGCVATANAKSGPIFQKSLTFDEVGEDWIAVGIAPGTIASPGFRELCPGPLAPEMWELISLKPKPDGTLSGDYTAVNSNGCGTQRVVTFTRTGDVAVNSVPDPAGRKPRVSAPAEALVGRYRRTYTRGGPPVILEMTAQTACLRTGERCISYLYSPDGVVTLVFADGKWTNNIDSESVCTAGGTAKFKEFSEFALPSPPQDPISLLIGHGRLEATGGTDCDGVTTDGETRLERIGD